MDSFEWNKIFGAVLGSVLFTVALYILVEGLMEPPEAEKPGMEVAVTEGTGTTTGGPTTEAPPDWGTVLPTADVAAGENVHKKCLTCHDFEKGGPNKIGPNLWGIIGSKHAHAAGFAYSAAMQAMADKTWDYEALNHFLTNPKAAIPGTKMAFAGLSKTSDRINIIAFLRTKADSPAPIPPPNPAAATPPAAPAGGAPAGAPADGAAGEPPAGEMQAPPPGEQPQTPGASPAPSTPPAGTAPAAPAQPSPTTTAPTGTNH
jgi:cytochrome c